MFYLKTGTVCTILLPDVWNCQLCGTLCIVYIRLYVRLWLVYVLTFNTSILLGNEDCNNGYANVPQCYVTRTFPVFFFCLQSATTKSLTKILIFWDVTHFRIVSVFQRANKFMINFPPQPLMIKAQRSFETSEFSSTLIFVTRCGDGEICTLASLPQGKEPIQ